MTLLELFELIKKRIRLFLFIPLVIALLAAMYGVIRPRKYTATTNMYVLTDVQQSETEGISTADMNLSQMVTNDLTKLLTSTRVRNDVAKQLGLQSIGGYRISVDSTSQSRVVTLRVVGNDPEMTARIANATVSATDRLAREIMGVKAVNTIDEAMVPRYPSGISNRRLVLLAFMAGLVAAVGVIVLLDLLDTRIGSGTEAEELIGVPVVGHFPHVERA